MLFYEISSEWDLEELILRGQPITIDCLDWLHCISCEKTRKQKALMVLQSYYPHMSNNAINLLYRLSGTYKTRKQQEEEKRQQQQKSQKLEAPAQKWRLLLFCEYLTICDFFINDTTPPKHSFWGEIFLFCISPIFRSLNIHNNWNHLHNFTTRYAHIFFKNSFHYWLYHNNKIILFLFRHIKN